MGGITKNNTYNLNAEEVVILVLDMVDIGVLQIV